MIRISSDHGLPPELESEHVEIIRDSAVIVPEGDKNTEASRRLVNHVLLPLVAGRWSSAEPPLFSVLSIETRSGCNYTCSFCPVSRAVDPRPAGELPWPLIEKIAGELADLGYSGRVCLFGNNEPLLDSRLPDIVAMFRNKCPHVDIRVLTNGTYASPPLVAQLFDSGLSTLTINNYTDGRRLIAPVRVLLARAAQFRDTDIRVSVRNRQQVLTTRAGLAPNKPAATAPQGFCALPFTDMYVTYTGAIGLCCFDAYARVRVGDVRTSGLWDAWTGAGYERHRTSLLQSRRSQLPACSQCDFDGFRPLGPGEGPSTRLQTID